MFRIWIKTMGFFPFGSHAEPFKIIKIWLCCLLKTFNHFWILSWFQCGQILEKCLSFHFRLLFKVQILKSFSPQVGLSYCQRNWLVSRLKRIKASFVCFFIKLLLLILLTKLTNNSFEWSLVNGCSAVEWKGCIEV